MPATLQLVTQTLQPRSQLRSVDAGGVVLRREDLVRLEGACLPVLPFSDVEDHGMSMELRRRVTVHRPRGIVLEGRGDEFPGRLRGMDVADPRLGVLLQILQSLADAFAVRFPHPVVAAHKSRERNRLPRGEGRIPAGAVLHARHFPSVLPS